MRIIAMLLRIAMLTCHDHFSLMLWRIVSILWIRNYIYMRCLITWIYDIHINYINMRLVIHRRVWLLKLLWRVLLGRILLWWILLRILLNLRHHPWVTWLLDNYFKIRELKLVKYEVLHRASCDDQAI